MIREWLRRRREARERQYRETLEILLKVYPDDDPRIVENLLGVPALRLATAQYLDKQARRREEEARIRAIVREELSARGH